MEENFVRIGTRSVWGGHKPFGLLSADRRQHVYTIGKTGTGKTSLLRNIILQDIEAGRGVGLIDPHGDLAEDLLNQIPPWRTDHVIYLNPVDNDFPIPFNLIRTQNANRHFLKASTVLSAFKNIWGDSWGPRLEYILFAAIVSLLSCENTSLLGMPRMLTDKSYRHWVVKQVKDPIVRSFWVNEFDRYEKRFLQEAIAPIQNKVGQLLMAAPVRNMVGQIQNRVDARFIMDNERIFIANLSKGNLGEDKSSLLGSFLVSNFQHAAMERASIPESARKDFFLFIDEFQNFATDSFASILSEARKYRLCLFLSHQYVEQIRPEIRGAVFGNVGSIISFRVGHDDAFLLEKAFGNTQNLEQFTELKNHEVRAKILANGEYDAPFTGKTLPPSGKFYGRKEILIQKSRDRYGTNKDLVEDRIARWLRKAS